MRVGVFIFLGIVCGTKAAWAQDIKASSKAPSATLPISTGVTVIDNKSQKDGPWNSGILSSINLGFRYSSLLERRGATEYDSLQLDPVLGIFMFDDRLEFLGDSLGYRDFFYDKTIRARTRIASVTDKPLFPKKESKLSFRNTRPDTYEWISSLEFFLPRYDGSFRQELDLNFSQDIATYHGQYAELVSKTKLFSFREPLGHSLIEPDLVVTIGAGSSSHNQYYYGQGAGGFGPTYFAAGLQLALPETADRYYPIVLFQYYSAIGQAARGSLVQDKPSGFLIQFIATIGLLD